MPIRKRRRSWASRKPKKAPAARGGSLGGGYWAMEKVITYRRQPDTGRFEFLVRWVGDFADTWEPEENLSDLALDEAKLMVLRGEAPPLPSEKDFSARMDSHDMQVAMEENTTKPQRSDPPDIKGPEDSSMASSNHLFELDNTRNDSTRSEAREGVSSIQEAFSAPPAEKIKNTEEEDAKPKASSTRTAVVHHYPPDPWDWSDRGQLAFREIQRISVHDATAPALVRDCRENGIPLCLTGHRGWAQFTQRWLRDLAQKDEAQEKEEVEEVPLLDLSQPHELDLEKVVKDIGNELVPVIRKKYDELNPIDVHMTFQSFVAQYWPQPSSLASNSTEAAATTHTHLEGHTTTTTTAATNNNNNNNNNWLYLHQWQFPLSQSAAKKLCGPGKNIPLPNGIFSEDLLGYWLDGDGTNGDSPFQYIFMGIAGTRSKLHKDSGGLDITIAPILGEKEVVLVHRADGPTALYHLEADIDKPNLDKFPMMYSARMWKSVIRPGEILIMPQGTYHQCVNLTPCLSYSRFFLDALNLKAFYESMLDRDACEILHDEILWNAANELMDRVDKYVESVRKRGAKAEGNKSELPTRISSAIDSLRPLRNIFRELVRRSQQQPDLGSAEWPAMVNDVDQCLHEFRCRHMKRIPAFEPSLPTISKPASAKKTSQSSGESSGPKVHPASSLHSLLVKSQNLRPNEQSAVISDSVVLRVGHEVLIRLHGKRLNGRIVAIEDRMTAAYLRFEEYTRDDSEYQPLSQLKVPVAGESSVSVDTDRLRVGMVVLYVEKGQEYRAVVESWKHATFYQILLLTSKCGTTCWVTRESIIETYSHARQDQSHMKGLDP